MVRQMCWRITLRDKEMSRFALSAVSWFCPAGRLCKAHLHRKYFSLCEGEVVVALVNR